MPFKYTQKISTPLSVNEKIFDKPYTPQADMLSKRILCLPLYPDLAMEHVDIIANEILGCLNQ